MVRVVLIEAEEVSHAIDVVRRHLYPDTPIEFHTESEVLREVTLLLNHILDTRYCRSDMSDREEILREKDYYRECVRCLRQVARRRDWRFVTSKLSSPYELIVYNSRGGVKMLL